LLLISIKQPSKQSSKPRGQQQFAIGPRQRGKCYENSECTPLQPFLKATALGQVGLVSQQQARGGRFPAASGVASAVTNPNPRVGKSGAVAKATRAKNGAWRCACTHVQACSGHRAYWVYNRIFARSRTPKCAKLVLGASAGRPAGG